MMTLRSFFSEPRIDSYSAMLSRTCFNSFEISSIESLVRRCNCSSRMASACLRGEGLFGIELRRAAGGVDVDLLAAEISDQVLAGVGAVGAGANDGDDVVEVIERREIAFENVLAVFRLLQAGRRCGGGLHRRGAR